MPAASRRRHHRLACLLVALLTPLLLGPTQVAAADSETPALRLPSVFGDHMVLQRDQPIPVWGMAAPGDEVVVTLETHDAEHRVFANAFADDQGRWSVTLRASPADLTAEQPATLSVTSGDQTATFTDVLLGEVWLVSGQSNMDWRLSRVDDADALIADADHDPLRLFRVERAVAAEPAFDVDAQWVRSNPDDARNFSGVGYLFGRQLQETLGVPVGILHTAYGGTPVEAWTPLESLAQNPETAPILKRHQSYLDRGVDRPERYNPAGLYHAMLKPLAPYALRGFAWYQGESNVWRAAQYEYTLTEMIHAWRADWTPEASDDDPLPFGVVQLPSYAQPPRVPPGQGSWPELREAQLRVAQTLPNVGLIVTTDVGDPTDIHPTNKQPVADRLVRWALASAYGHDLVPTGPLLVDHRIEGDRVILTFDHVGSGLSSADSDVPNGFCVAGPDKKFRWATHVEILDERTLSVGEAKVPEPQAVRYGWDENIPWATLTNSEGLPASPFRTDTWERITEDSR